MWTRGGRRPSLLEARRLGGPTEDRGPAASRGPERGLRSSALRGDKDELDTRRGGSAVLKWGDSIICERAQGQDLMGTVTPLLVPGDRVLFGDALAIGREDTLMERT